jgi:hypothetical protein
MEANMMGLPKPDEDLKFPPNLDQVCLLSTIGKLLERVILEIIQRHVEGSSLLGVVQFEFRANPSTILRCMRLSDPVTFNFNAKMSTAAVFLDINEASDILRHPSLLHK